MKCICLLLDPSGLAIYWQIVEKCAIFYPQVRYSSQVRTWLLPPKRSIFWANFNYFEKGAKCLCFGEPVVLIYMITGIKQLSQIFIPYWVIEDFLSLILQLKVVGLSKAVPGQGAAPAPAAPPRCGAAGDPHFQPRPRASEHRGMVGAWVTRCLSDWCLFCCLDKRSKKSVFYKFLGNHYMF